MILELFPLLWLKAVISLQKLEREVWKNKWRGFEQLIYCNFQQLHRNIWNPLLWNSLPINSASTWGVASWRKAFKNYEWDFKKCYEHACINEIRIRRRKKAGRKEAAGNKDEEIKEVEVNEAKANSSHPEFKDFWGRKIRGRTFLHYL